MDPSLPRFMTRMILSTTPQQAFEQVDELILQASALREQTQELQDQIDFLNDRADCLTATAEGLQEIAEQDRDAIQTMFDRSLCAYKHMYAVYVSAPRKEARFNDIKTRSEDGMVTMEEMEAFLEDVYQYFLVTSERVQRSAAPEPESPPNTLDTLSSIEQAQSESQTELAATRGQKRKLSAFQEVDESVIEVGSEGSNNLNDGGLSDDSEGSNNPNDDVMSDDEASSDEDDEAESTDDAQTEDEGTTQVVESSDEESESANDGDTDDEDANSEETGSSVEETGSDSSTGSHTAVNVARPTPKYSSRRS